jgi:hypothetical protein
MFIPLGCLRGALAPLHENLPLPLIKGKGIQGIGLMNIRLVIPIHGCRQTFSEEAINSFTHPGDDLDYNLSLVRGEITKYISNNISLADFGKASGSWSSNPYPEPGKILAS